MAILSKTNSHSDVMSYFKEHPFYYKSIKRPVKRLKHIDQWAGLYLYEQLSIIKTDPAFKGYAMSNKVETIEKKYPFLQLEGSILSIKNLFSNLFNELNGFKYQITLEVLFKNTSIMEKLNLHQFILIQ